MLLKNDNKKFIKTLSNNCLKANRIRNRIALLAIILTALLFTTITTVFQGAQKSMEEQQLHLSGSRFMVSIKYMTPEKAGEILDDEAFTKAGIERAVSMAGNEELKRISAAVTWMDEVYAKGNYCKPQKGHMPEQSDEIACDSVVLKLLGLPYETGTKFKLKYDVNGESREKEMTICGIWKGNELEENSSMLVSRTFLEENIDKSTLTEGAAVAGAYTVRGSFSNAEDIEGQLDKVLKNAGYHPQAERGEEGFIIHHVNPAYEKSMKMDGGTVAAIIIGILLVLLAGYLIIYNIFRISVIKDIRLYGQLKTIGTSPKQIQYMVRRQGMRLAWYGIPAGLVLGWLLGNILLPLVMQTMIYNESSFIWPDLFVWAASVVFTLLTVWISCSRPGKIAGRISPVEALRYQEQSEGRKKEQKGAESRNRILGMAFSNLGRNKGKTALVVMSISLSIILLNSVLNAVGCFEKEIYVNHKTVADFNVMSVQMQRYTGSNTEKFVKADFAEELKTQPGVKDFGKTYCYEMTADDNQDGTEQLSLIESVNGKKLKEDSIDGIEPSRMMMGFDENALKRCKVIEGEIDYEKLQSGDYVVAVGYLDDDDEYHKASQEFHAGDILKIKIKEEIRTVQVMAVAGASYTLMPDYSMGGYEAIGFAENVFLGHYPENQGPIHCIFDAEKGKFDEINNALKLQETVQNIKIDTRLSAEAEFDEMTAIYTGVGVVLAMLFAVIGILNLMNVILTSAISRQGEFATMRSIGMTRKQLRTMFMLEGIFYAVLAGSVGAIVSGILSLTMVKGIVGAFWFAKYSFMIVPALIAAVVCVVVAAVIAFIIDRMLNCGSIVENLRRSE